MDNSEVSVVEKQLMQTDPGAGRPPGLAPSQARAQPSPSGADTVSSIQTPAGWGRAEQSSEEAVLGARLPPDLASHPHVARCLAT